MKIKNYDEILKELTELLVHFTKECHPYNTDIHLYHDNDTQTAELETYVYVGGRGQRMGSYYIIYTDEQHEDGWLMWYQSVREFSDFLGVSVERLEEETRKYFDFDDDDDVGYSDVYGYIMEGNEGYRSTLKKAYDDGIDILECEEHNHMCLAKEILSDFIDDDEK